MGFLLDEAGNQLLDEAGQPLFDEAGDPRLPDVPPVDPGGVLPIVQPVWTWVLADPAPSVFERIDLKTGYGRRITFRIDGVSDAQFSMNGASAEAKYVTEMSTDVIGYRRTQGGLVERLYRGRIITETDEVAPDEHFTQFSTNDYRGMLQNRMVNALGYTIDDTPVNIITTLLARTQAAPGGNWGISPGIYVATPGSVHVDYTAGADLLEAFTNLGHLQSTAFEWEIDSNLKFNMWMPTRGTVTGVTLDFGGIVTGFRKTLTSTSFGNSIVVSGDGRSTTPVTLESSTIATDPQGRWERFLSDSNIADQATLVQRANWMLDLTNTVRPQYVVTLASGRWDRSTMWLGDTVRFVARKGRLVINEMQRIVEINVSINEDGLEDVQLGLLPA